MEKMKMSTPDLTDVNIEKIGALFPNIITETRNESGEIIKAVDFDLLKQALSKSLVEDENERYRLDWPGKKASLLKANTPITKTLRPCRDESVNFDTTENLYIEGDNFEVLKILQESYLGKIKMIYIDPPYNTGNDFIYRDNFSKNKDEYELGLGLTDEEGGKLFKNTDTNGRYHSDWLSMMYERLLVARDLLKEDGAIFISIDDNEVHNLRKVCDEIFGEDNFITEIVWKKKTGAGTGIQFVFDEHEYVLVYIKNTETESRWRIMSVNDGNFINPDKDPKGPWESCAFTAPSKNRNPNQLFLIEVHFGQINATYELVDEKKRMAFDSFNYNGNTIVLRKVDGDIEADYSFYDDQKQIAKFIKRWAYASQNIKEVFRQNRVYLKGSNVPRYKKYKTEYEGKALRSIYFNDFSTQQGTDALRALFDNQSYVDYPKPIELLKHFINGVVQEEEIILDFFSGSATTAHAVMALNAEDDGSRKFIMVQLPEDCDESSEAFKAGYKNIAEIGKERIRRAGMKIIQELKDKNQQLELGEDPVDPNRLDIGFRVYKTDSSNMKEVFYHPSELDQKMLSSLESNIKEDRTPEDLLTQVILDLGLELTLPIEINQILGNTVYFVQTNALVACFDENVDFNIVDHIADHKPLRVVFRDASFVDDKDRINVEERFKRLSPETKVTVI
jgi:adenine-specific DNA-methyltransferase